MILFFIEMILRWLLSLKVLSALEEIQIDYCRKQNRNIPIYLPRRLEPSELMGIKLSNFQDNFRWAKNLIRKNGFKVDSTYLPQKNVLELFRVVTNDSLVSTRYSLDYKQCNFEKNFGIKIVKHPYPKKHTVLNIMHIFSIYLSKIWKKNMHILFELNWLY